MHEKVANRILYILSDASGERASYFMQGALEQFNGLYAELRFPNVRSESEIALVMHAAAERGSVVVFTFAEAHMRATARTAAEGLGVKYIDLFEQSMSVLSEWFGVQPRNSPGHSFDKRYFERLKAIDFASLHDDGKRSHELMQAQVVILGVSRTSKTPVCDCLAKHRILAANVPIVPGVELPSQLEKVDPQRVYILRIGIERLLVVRQNRWNVNVAGDNPYTDRDVVREEIRRINKLIAEKKEWTPIEVTNRSVEETSAIIMSTHQKRFSRK